MNFDLNALRTIVVGAKLGSFAQAARQLGRSQSAVSMQLKKLEEQAGLPLFVRSKNKLVPTEAGNKLLSYAEKIIALNDEAAASLGTHSSVATVRLGMPQDFADKILPSILEQFSRQYSNVHVEVDIGRNYALAEEVKLGRLDIALVFTPQYTGNGEDLIAEMEMVWAGPADKGIISNEGPIPLVAFNFPCEFRQHAIDALEQANRPWRYALSTPSLAGIWAAISAGLGITVRTKYQTPEVFLEITKKIELPDLPTMFVTQIEHSTLTPAATALSKIVKSVAIKELSND